MRLCLIFYNFKGTVVLELVVQLELEVILVRQVIPVIRELPGQVVLVKGDIRGVLEQGELVKGLQEQKSPRLI